MKNALIILFLGIFFYSCRSETETKFDSSKCEKLVVLPNAKDKVFASDLIEKVDYVQLETNDHCLINEITKVHFYEGKYFVLDSKSSKVLCFDDKGKFLFTVGALGKGPGEYSGCDEMFVDEKRKLIIVNDLNKEKKTLSYTLEGKFVGQKFLKYNSLSVLPINDKYNCFYLGFRGNHFEGSKKYSMVIGNHDDSENKYFFPVDNYSDINVINKTFSYIYHDTVTLIPFFNNVIYRLTEKEYFQRYLIDFGKYNVTESDLKKVSERISRKEGKPIDILKDINLVFSIDDFIESPDILFFTYHLSRSWHFVYYSKKSKKIYQAVNGMNDNIKSGIMGAPVGLMDQNFIYSLPTYFLHSDLQRFKDYQKYVLSDSPELKKVATNTKLDDNPILLIVNFKKSI